ncbi:DNA circularization protein [Neisseria sp. S1]|uniref:DNA circularization protein n=1 Tax=Neisseria sp. S1 TaxID=3318354 RepID=UPI003A844A4A
MSGWHTVLQDASYKDAGFAVQALDESNGKALVEHARPFVQGIDLEDMGTTGRQVQVSAVFWGKGYHGKLLRLLEALEDPGAGVLVHPVWGRLQNMIAASWSYRHEADYVDYATIDITFREAAEAQKIFIFENSFLVALENLIAAIDSYREAAFGFIDALLAVDAGISDLWGSALGIWSAGAGVFSAMRGLFDFDAVGWSWGGSYSHAAFREGLGANMSRMADMVSTGLASDSATAVTDTRQGGLSARRRFDAAALTADKCNALPADLLSGKGQMPQLQKITPAQMQPVVAATRAAVCAAMVSLAATLIEDEGEQMSAPELMHINRQMRLRIQSEIEFMRDIQSRATSAGSVNADALYSRAYEAAEALRRTAGGLNSLIVAAINQKPPLIVRAAPINGTIHQIAFAFYGDISRADELMRLNPHIRHPAFIDKGIWVNGYAK